jgi:ribose transport system permease protein
MEIIRNSLTLSGIGTFWQGTFVGTFIVLTVGVRSHPAKPRSRQ